jgi:hypothetical protein
MTLRPGSKTLKPISSLPIANRACYFTALGTPENKYFDTKLEA